jgi:hypothetical protein
MIGSSGPTLSTLADDESIVGSERVIEQLSTVIHQDLILEGKSEQTLELWREALLVDSRNLIGSNGETNHWKTVVNLSSRSVPFLPDHAVDLESTYCRWISTSQSQMRLTGARTRGWDNKT